MNKSDIFVAILGVLSNQPESTALTDDDYGIKGWMTDASRTSTRLEERGFDATEIGGETYNSFVITRATEIFQASEKNNPELFVDITSGRGGRHSFMTDCVKIAKEQIAKGTYKNYRHDAGEGRNHRHRHDPREGSASSSGQAGHRHRGDSRDRSRDSRGSEFRKGKRRDGGMSKSPRIKPGDIEYGSGPVRIYGADQGD